MVIQEPVQAAIWHCLNQYDYSDAIFLAERLYAEVCSDEALYLLATCYYRSGKPARAYTLLKTKVVPTPQCRYLLAQCCIETNKLSEAEAALSGNILHKAKTPEDVIRDFGDSASFALHLLADIYRKTERTSKAVDSYRRSLKINPYLWSSFEALCQLGERPDPAKTFLVTTQNCMSGDQVAVATQTTPTLPQQPINILQAFDSPQIMAPTNKTPQIIPPSPVDETIKNVTPANDPSIVSSIVQQGSMAPTIRRIARRPGKTASFGSLVISPLTPSFGILPLEATPSPNVCGSGSNLSPWGQPPTLNLLEAEVKANKKPMARRQPSSSHPKPAVFSQSGNTNTMRDLQQSPTQATLQGNNIPNLRRSTRLFSASSSSVKENNKSQSQKKFAMPKAPAKKSKTKTQRTPQELNEINKADMAITENLKSPQTPTTPQAQIALLQKQSADGLMSLMQQLGLGFVALSNYELRRAVHFLSSIPSQHLNTGWVKCQIGRAYYEMAEYAKAEKVFSEVHQTEPYHMEGMEIYSTALWHLQKEVQLSALAQELVELDRDAPEAWLAAGNCFSAQKEHDVAIKYFQRAVQVNPNFSYAYTLLGYEYIATEELDKALACFRNAIRVDPRHYNAWYGLGTVYYKQEKLTLAEVHFKKALAINPQSSVLLCHIGVVQHALKKTDSALQTLNKAITADPKNPLCKFHRASILFASEKHKEALKELEELKEIVPRESLVYFLIGKVHKKLGNTHLALMNFSWAMDLDPKGANNHIKEAIDKRYVTDDDELGAGTDASLEDPIEASSNDSSLMDADEVQLQAMESDESL